jgi:nucleoside-diphosphate-sugar epimerase
LAGVQLNKMKALVAGGGGFIGSHLCEALLKQGHWVIAVDNFLTSVEANIAPLLKNPQFKIIKQDVIEPLTLSEKLDLVIHLASPASPNLHSKISYHQLPLETMLVNTTGTLNLLQLAEKNQARFLFASTSEIYGDPTISPQPESYRGNVSTTGPRSVYDEAKRFGETLVSYFHRYKKLDTRTARIFNTYGPRILKEDQRMITNFIVQALSGKPLTVYGDGTQTRSLCYIDDLVSGLISLIMTDKLDGEVVNLGTAEEHSVSEFAEMVRKLTNTKSKIEFTESLPEDDPKERCPNLQKAKALLHWKPMVSLEQGIKKTIEFYR